MAGLPGIDSLSSYGGAKTNDAPVEDNSTDESADHRNLYAANVAGMTQTVDRAWCRFVGHGTTPTDPASNVHAAVWGNGVSVKPVPARTGAGVYTITWPTSVTDELGVSHTVNLRSAKWNVEGSTPYTLTVTLTSVNVATVRVFDMAGVANDGVGTTFAIYVT